MQKNKLLIFAGFVGAVGLALIPIYVVPKVNPDMFRKLHFYISLFFKNSDFIRYI